MFDLYLIGDRAAFRDDASWLAALTVVAPLVTASPRVGLQIRLRSCARADEVRLAAAARERLGRAAERTFLAGVEAPAYGYAGVHATEAALRRGSVGSNARACGVSVHSLEALRLAEAAGATFAVFGPVFDPGTKPVRGVGVDALRTVATAARIPVLALGGVTPERTLACLDAGASGLAVASGVFGAPDPAAAVGHYLRSLAVNARDERGAMR